MKGDALDALDRGELEALRGLLAREEITRVLLDYARGVDQRNYELVRACFHPDARIDYGVFAGSREDLIRWLEEIQPRVDRTIHFFGPPRIELDPDRSGADVESYCINTTLLPRDEAGATRRTIAGLRYLDRFECREEAWRLVERRNVPDWTAQI